MRIDQLRQGMPPIAAPPGHQEVSPAAQPMREFRRELTTLGQEQYDAHIQSLIAAIAEQAETLKRRADMAEFARYREMIQGLINETVNNAFAFHRQGSFDARGRHRVFAVVRRINARLDDMAQEFLRGQAEQLRVLDAIDDIRGLLLDLFI